MAGIKLNDKLICPICGFELYQYKTANGEFDYEKYKKIQTTGNKEKLKNVWAIEENIAFLSDYLKANIKDIKYGVCHGTRRGKEQEWFKKYLGCDVFGTEISDTATQFPNTIQWDFHEVKPEWLNSFDFIYSNSFDHSYDPEKCLNAWMSCLKQEGVCVLEHSSNNEYATTLDSFGASLETIPYLILLWSKGKFSVVDVLDVPKLSPLIHKNREKYYNKFLIIKKNKPSI